MHGDDWSTAPESYLTLVRSYTSADGSMGNVIAFTSCVRHQGLGHCFEKTDEGKLKDKFVIEPITANSLECMAAGMLVASDIRSAQQTASRLLRVHQSHTGGKTCFKHVTSLTFEQAMSKDKRILPESFNDGLFCEDYEFRCGASARTWQRSHAQDNLL